MKKIPHTILAAFFYICLVTVGYSQKTNVFEIAFRNSDGGDDSDPYRLRKVNVSPNSNYLELQLNDDADESFRIYGNSCAGYSCGEYSSNLYHSFNASGDAFHSRNLTVGGKTLFGNWSLAAFGQWPTNPGFLYVGGNETFGFASTGGQISIQIDGAFRQQEAGTVNYFMDKVGIGNTNPDAMLTVSGQVHAQEVKVTINAPGPDYVFEKDYKLSSLEEIKNYIDQNKHLPEVPSAKEMEKNGVQLGEMNMLLLKKIEELTLHTIQLNNEVEELKRENEFVKEQMKLMQSKIGHVK